MNADHAGFSFQITREVKLTFAGGKLKVGITKQTSSNHMHKYTFIYLFRLLWRATGVEAFEF